MLRINNGALSLPLTVFLTTVIGFAEYTHGADVFEEIFEKRRSYIRAAYDVLKDEVNVQNKVLITPYVEYSQRRGFESVVYFSKNASYIADCNHVSLESWVKKNNISYIVVTPPQGHDLRRVGDDLAGNCYGMKKGQYSIENDGDYIRSFVKQKEGVLVASDSGLGEIYRINR